MTNTNKIELDRMTGLKEAIILDDVWTGKTNRAERKRIQNRLNQRAFKKRKAHLESQPTAERSNRPQASCPKPRTTQIRPAPTDLPSLLTPINLWALQNARKSPEVIFPLSTDHLLTLVQYNVIRAMILNFKILSVMGDFSAECHALYNSISVEFPLPDVPPTFQYTTLQMSTPHDTWIDTIPCGQLRDNLIIAINESSLDGFELCRDLVGGWCEGRNDVEMRGMIAWSHTWSPCGWEVTEGFLLKWGYLLKGCKAMLASTNKWRATRGEEALVWEV